jgi:hypothetical protein
MSFFKALKNKVTAPKATVQLKLSKSSYSLGENVEGTLAVSSSEDFAVTEIRCEIQCVEEAKKMKRVYDQNRHIYIDREFVESATLFAAKPTVSGPLTLNNGYAGTFPINMNIPAGARPTFKSVDGRVTWFVKGVIAVDGRPDVTSSTSEIQVVQPAAASVTVAAAPVIKEVVREVVMIPCKYCGGLMPQTQTSCPNCGAKRTI